MLKIKQIYDYAKKYQKQMGKAWESLFDYLNEVGYENAYRNKKQLLDLFSNYMGQFGMFRRSIDKKTLKAILWKNKKRYLSYLMHPSKTNMISAWKATYEYLAQYNNSTSKVLITKILMGFGGRTPAYDSHFMNTICFNPSFVNSGVKHLVSRLKRAFEKKPLRTIQGNYPIPWCANYQLMRQ